MRKVSRIWGVIACCLVAFPSQAMVQDTVVAVEVAADTVKSRTRFQRFIDYFADANKEKKHKKFDFSVIGGPSYSNDTKFGIGVVASGLYRADPADSLLQPSNVSIFGSVSTSGFYVVGIRGSHLFPQDRFRLDYSVHTISFPSYFWGLGYDQGKTDGNKSSYTRKQNTVKLDFLIRVADNLYIGPGANFDYIYGKNIDRPELFEGQKSTVISTGFGASVVYDTRDFQTNAYRGVYLKLEQKFFPSFTGNKYSFIRTDFIADYYKQVWKGGILAFDFHTQLNYGGTTPWTMMARLGGSYRMRGYYEGRYRDNNLTEVQVELRQRVYRRSGIAVWVGAGNVYKDFSNFHWNQTLPNYGVGYRWEFKKRVNVRLDYGFGKGQSGFMFQINEAF